MIYPATDPLVGGNGAKSDPKGRDLFFIKNAKQFLKQKNNYNLSGGEVFL